MKDYSCAQIKKRHKVVLQQQPKLGSKVREVFDLFHTYKGQRINFSKHTKDIALRIQYLKLFYGMDIVHVKKNTFCFRGEYVGAVYVSYEPDQLLNIKLKAK